jgi:hypothetical protein
MFVLEKQNKSNMVARLRRRLEIELPEPPEPLLEETAMEFEEIFNVGEPYEQESEGPGEMDIPF